MFNEKWACIVSSLMQYLTGDKQVTLRIEDKKAIVAEVAEVAAVALLLLQIIVVSLLLK